MKRIYNLFIILLLLPGIANALGLGKLELNSALNEPFDAKIALLSATAGELDSLNVGLADSDAFARANIDRPFLLGKLKFKLVRSETGDDYIRVTSQDSIREPFLNFLLEVNWSNGRLFREYTVLLDPPMYDPNLRANEFSSQEAAAPASTTSSTYDRENAVVYAEDFERFSSGDSRPASTPAVNYSGGDYGPTSANDTLWSIASAMRPDSSVSVNQMMLALLSANPDAFLNNNINGLKRGQILSMPDASDMSAYNSAEALAEVKNQYAAWEQVKGSLAGSVASRPDTSSGGMAADSSVTTATDMDEDAELKLVAANDETSTTEQVAAVDGDASGDLILAQESIQALTQENLELQDRLQESEALLQDLKRLLELKDDELAALQGQLGAAETAVDSMETSEVMEDTMEVMTEETDDAVADTAEVIEETAAVVEEEIEQAVSESDEATTDEVVEETVEAETIDVIEVEPDSGSTGILGMVEPYLAPVTNLVGGNPLYAIAVVGLLVVLILVGIATALKKKKSTASDTSTTAEANVFPEFDTGNDDLDTAEKDLESEAATEFPESEDETFIPGDNDDNADDEPYLQEGADAPVVEEEEVSTAAEMATDDEEEEDEDPLQEVNTYLAFEQFDQAEEFVRNAIEDKPDNAEFHTKLLEVFYTSGNKKSYEEEARVLHDLVNGEGEHWDMAVAMWSEMSPNRALFEEGGDDDEMPAADTSGGFVDVTADEESKDDGGLDFDIGAGEEEKATAAESSDEELLDITAADEGEDVLDVTAADEGEDILDVTAAVGLDDTDDSAESESSDEDDMLDISGSSAGEDLLDVTAVGEADDAGDKDDDVLDISASGSDSEDLLDVTAASDMELDASEDLLDVTAATGAGADSDELLDLEIDETEEDSASVDADSDNVIDFDPGSTTDVNDTGLELDLGTEDDSSEDVSDGLELNLGESSDNDADGLELDLGESDSQLDNDDSDEPIRLDMDLETEESAASEDELDMNIDDASLSNGEEEISLDMTDDSSPEDDGLSLDMESSADSTDDEISLDLDIENESSDEADAAPEMDFDLSLDDDSADDSDVDMDGTVELDSSALQLDDDDDDDEEDQTVFVPRAAQPEEQSAEDEIATKLDLAKAYVELGDKDSAKTILDEVMADGNDEQKQQAQDLMNQT